MSIKDVTLERMSLLGIMPKRSLGQNFLVSEGVVQKIIESVKITNGELIEIGPGLGALTDRLRELGRPFKAIELDKKFVEYWTALGLEVIEADALKVNWKDVIKTPSVLVSNLPYQISSRLIIDLSFVNLPLQKMVFMFQKEVAERIVAAPRSEDYGMLSVVAQIFWRMDKVTNAGTHDFMPPPNVTSRVLEFVPRAQVPDRDEKLLSFIKLAFAKRRKFLTNNLESSYDREKLVGALEELGHGAKARAEELSPQQFVELFKRLSGK
jgi:16S rRNA (adenine1518-N6/adenine1519-N6)-dimethyltransferase